MKKKLLSIALMGFAFVASSQTTIFKENFNSYAVGSNLSADLSGSMPGQGGWVTTALLNGNNAATQLVQLSPNDNALQFTGYNLANTSPVSSSRSLSHTFDWLNRPTGQNFFNFEFVMQVGGITTSENNFTSYVLDQSGQILMGIRFDYKTREIFGLVYDEAYPATNPVTYAAGGVPLGKGFTKLIIGDDEQYIQIGMGYSVSDGDFYIGVRGLDKPALSGFMWATSAPLTGKQPYELKYFAIAGATNIESASVIIDDITVKAQSCIFPNSAEFKYNSTSACIGTANLTPSRDVTYTGVFSSTPTGLSIDAATGVIDMTNSLAGSYTVKFITNVDPADLQNGACSDFHTEQIEILAMPTATVTANGSTPFCSTTPVLLTAPTLSGASYEWKNASSTLLSTNQSFSAPAGGSYSVKVTHPNGCSVVSATQVVNSLPTATITANGPTTFCQASSVVLTASSISGATYEWSAGSSTLGVSASYSATETGSYTVKVTASNGCSAVSSPLAVTVNQLPIASITGNTSFCSNNSAVLTASSLSGASYEWTNASSTIVLNTTQRYSATAAGGYIVKVTDSNGCSAVSSTHNVTENLLPTATISITNGSTTFCQASSVTLTASTITNGSYEWSNGSSTLGTSINQIVTVAGSYTLKVTGANGCSAVSLPTDVINNLPTATITASGTNFACSGNTVTLSAPTGYTSYQWKNGSVSLGTSSQEIVSAAGIYTVEVTDGGGCFNVSSPLDIALSSAGVTAQRNITPQFAPISVCSGVTPTLPTTSLEGIIGTWSVPSGSTYTFTANPDQCLTNPTVLLTVNVILPTATISASNGSTTFCQGSSVTLLASSLSGASYEWSNGSSILGSSIDEIVSTSGSYTVKVTDVNGCSNTSSPTVVTVNSLPIATITTNGPTTFCQGSSVTLTASAGSSYLWSTGAITASISPTTAGSYTVKVTNASTCSQTSTPTDVTVNSLPIASINAGGVTTFCQGGSVTLTASAGSSYLWSGGSTSTSASVTATTAGSYTVEVTGANGCKQTSSATVVTVNPFVTPSFSAAAAICSGQVPTLPASSTNATPILGTWSPAIGSIIATTNYTFTPKNVGCYNPAPIYTVTVTPNVLPTFVAPAAICSGQVASLPLTSTNATPITGTWSPVFAAITAPTQYTFTASTVGCFTTGVKVTVPVTQNVIPTFATPVAICSGQVASLPLTSTNSVAGTWSPAFAKITAATDYTFIPTAVTGSCFTSGVKVTVPVSTSKVVPTFTLVDWVCKDSLAIALPLISTNSIVGTWKAGTPSVAVTTISTTAVGEPTYTFTPTTSTPTNNCPQTFTKSIKVIECLLGGVEEAIVSPFTIYPNPSNDVISISFSELTSKNGTIRFISAEGKLIESREYTNSSVETFDVKSLNPGIYFLQIDNAIEKVVVQ